MTADLDRLLDRPLVFGRDVAVDPASVDLVIAERVDEAGLGAVGRLVVATVWLAAAYPAKLSSLIGD